VSVVEHRVGVLVKEGHCGIDERMLVLRWCLALQGYKVILLGQSVKIFIVVFTGNPIVDNFFAIELWTFLKLLLSGCLYVVKHQQVYP